MGEGDNALSLEFGQHASDVVGPRNSGKTTWLRVIDYCLGDSDPVGKAVGPDVADVFGTFRLTLEIAGTRYQIERRPADYGFAGRIFVDGSDFSVRDFSTWILQTLGWPPGVQIPKAIRPENASELTPLTFRTLFRHLYRKETSWADFANNEWEHHRRAVLRYFLGALDAEGEIAEFYAARAERAVEALRERIDDAVTTSNETIRSVSFRLGVDLQSAAQLQDTIRSLNARMTSLGAERLEIEANVTAADSYHSELNDEYAAAAQSLSEAVTAQEAISGTLRDYATAAAAVEADLARLERAKSAVGIFADIPVRQCPACGQGIEEHPDHEGDCYVCGQAVTEDLRHRRIEIEQSTLREELADLRQQVDRTRLEEERSTAQTIEARAAVDAISRRISDARKAVLAPHVARLQGLSAEVASIQQAANALEGFSVVTTRIERLRSELAAAQTQRDKLVRANLERDTMRAAADQRCERFAGEMNTFLLGLQREPWQFGTVHLRPTDMAFLVEGEPWEDRLGGETRVVFLLAYHFALLRLTAWDDPAVRAPGIAILDNPIQHGVPDLVVAEALDRLRQCARVTGTQLLTTIARSLPSSVPAETIILLDQQYGTDEDLVDDDSDDPASS